MSQPSPKGPFAFVNAIAERLLVPFEVTDQNGDNANKTQKLSSRLQNVMMQPYGLASQLLVLDTVTKAMLHKEQAPLYYFSTVMVAVLAAFLRRGQKLGFHKASPAYYIDTKTKGAPTPEVMADAQMRLLRANIYLKRMWPITLIFIPGMLLSPFSTMLMLTALASSALSERVRAQKIMSGDWATTPGKPKREPKKVTVKNAAPAGWKPIATPGR